MTKAERYPAAAPDDEDASAVPDGEDASAVPDGEIAAPVSEEATAAPDNADASAVPDGVTAAATPNGDDADAAAAPNGDDAAPVGKDAVALPEGEDASAGSDDEHASAAPDGADASATPAVEDAAAVPDGADASATGAAGRRPADAPAAAALAPETAAEAEDGLTSPGHEEAPGQSKAERAGARRLKRMALTPDLVARTVREMPDLGPEEGWTALSEEELDALAADWTAQSGTDPLWVFAYGSLIWKPDFDAIGHQRATAYGWHRSFCMTMRRWRGSPETPGLMMALERGGRCDGVIYRMPDDDRFAQVRRMLRREVRFHQNVSMVRWIKVHAEEGPLRVLVFWAGPTGPRIQSRLPLEEVAPILARACGPVGSCAEYLFNTVSHLEAFGIHDRNLWRLQALVAAEINRGAHPAG